MADEFIAMQDFDIPLDILWRWQSVALSIENRPGCPSLCRCGKHRWRDFATLASQEDTFPRLASKVSVPNPEYIPDLLPSFIAMIFRSGQTAGFNGRKLT
jgi:hypothetical protein